MHSYVLNPDLKTLLTDKLTGQQTLFKEIKLFKYDYRNDRKICRR